MKLTMEMFNWDYFQFWKIQLPFFMFEVGLQYMGGHLLHLVNLLSKIWK